MTCMEAERMLTSEMMLIQRVCSAPASGLPRADVSNTPGGKNASALTDHLGRDVVYRFRSFIEGRYGKPTMAVSERREQFVARRLLNAFVEQHYPANQLRWGRTGPSFISLRRLADVAVSQEAERYLGHVRGPSGAGQHPDFGEGSDQSW